MKRNCEKQFSVFGSKGGIINTHTPLKNCVDPDQLKPTDLDLHCFQNVIHLDGFTMVMDENVHANPTPAAFVCFDSLCPSQQFFNYVEMGLPGLNQF